MTTHDETLSILIERNWFARESYHRRKDQEMSFCEDGPTSDLRRGLTTVAEVAWKQAEADLWKHRAAVGTTSSKPRPVRPVRRLFDSMIGAAGRRIARQGQGAGI